MTLVCLCDGARVKVTADDSCRRAGALNLGNQFLTGVFPENKKQYVTKGYLSLVICKNCSLLQLEHSFDTEEMYGDNYGYPNKSPNPGKN